MTDKQFISLQIGIITISDTRTELTDKSGKYLLESLIATGHNLVGKIIVPDNIYQIRAVLSNWIADNSVQVIITTGGTGVTGKDGTPEAVKPLLDKVIEGFGEIFRYLSYQEIKANAVQSRALAGVANNTYIFCLPGSTGGCRTAWENLIKPQLDSRDKLCNLAQLLPRLAEN